MFAEQATLAAQIKNIVKGNVQNDWFLTAVVCLLEKNEQLIKRLFETKEANEEGVYRVSLYVTGRWRTITVDDYIPCHANGGPFFSTITDKTIWLNILEKALAKVHGGYRYLEGGTALEGLRTLTGVPITSFIFEEASVVEMLFNNSLRKLLVSFLSKRSFVVVASTEPNGTFFKESN